MFTITVTCSSYICVGNAGCSYTTVLHMCIDMSCLSCYLLLLLQNNYKETVAPIIIIVSLCARNT